jgi:hypothetical protein
MSAICPQNVRINADYRTEQKRRVQKSKKETPTPLRIPDGLSTPEFQSAWTDWQHHRREIKKALTPTQTTKQLEQFAEWGVSRSVAAIRHTIRMGWQGIREPETPSGSFKGNGQSSHEAAMRQLEKMGKIGKDDE